MVDLVEQTKLFLRELSSLGPGSGNYMNGNYMNGNYITANSDMMGMGEQEEYKSTVF